MRLLLLALLLLAACGEARAADDFSFDSEGWTVVGQTVPDRFILQKRDGNPAGSICATGSDTDLNFEPWYFVAPSKYWGDASRSYGKRLTWDLKINFVNDPISCARGSPDCFQRDVVIQGRGVSITAMAPNQTLSPNWGAKSQAVDLSTITDWRLNDENLTKASEIDIRVVLTNVVSLQLRGDWRVRSETVCLDNVYFGIP